MTSTVCVADNGDGTFAVEMDGSKLGQALDDFEQALKVTDLVIRAELGEGDDARDAAEQLAAMGVEPPTLQPDDAPLPTPPGR